MTAHTPDALASALPAAWHVADDAVGEPTLWHGDTAVLRRCDINTGGELLGGEMAEYRELIWFVLTAVLAPDEVTVERLAEASHDAYEAAAIEAGWETQQRSRKPWADVPEANKATVRVTIRAVLAALGASEQTGPNGGQGEAVRAG